MSPASGGEEVLLMGIITKTSVFKTKEKKKNELAEKALDRIMKYYVASNGVDEEDRVEQERLAIDIAESLLGEEKMVLAEGATGLGKTKIIALIAYYAIKAMGKRVIVSTSSISLQEQMQREIGYYFKEFDIYENSKEQESIKPVLCLGKGNYVCRAKLAQEKFPWVEDYLQGNTVTTRTSLPFEVKNQEWERFRGGQCYKSCPAQVDCRFQKDRQAMKHSSLLITNHQLMLADKQKTQQGDPSLFGKMGNSINLCDEAHNLRDAAIAMLSREQRESPCSSGFFRKLEHLLLDEEDGESVIAIPPELSEDALVVASSTEDIDEALFFRGLGKELKSSSTGNIFWCSKENGELVLFQLTKSLSKKIGSLLSQVPSAFLSGTLTDGDSGDLEMDYRYIVEALGIKDPVLVEPAKSPFNPDQGMFYVSQKVQDPRGENKGENKEDWYNEVEEEITSLLNISKGRALVLFTSKKDLEEMYNRLRVRLAFPVLKQAHGSEQRRIVESFLYNEESVLLGTDALREGLNIPGNSLKNVIQVRLPFRCPGPLDSLHQAEDAHVGEMCIKLKQGVGRVLRTERDRGVFCLLDPRGFDKKMPYSPKVRNVLSSFGYQVTSKTNDLKKHMKKK